MKYHEADNNGASSGVVICAMGTPADVRHSRAAAWRSDFRNVRRVRVYQNVEGARGARTKRSW